MGKMLRSEKLKSLLDRGLRKAKGSSVPSDGAMLSLINEDSRNGWHWQVDYVHDVRIHPEPYVVAFGFKPRTRGCASASHYLTSYN